MLSCHLKWQLLQSRNNNVRVLFGNVKKLCVCVAKHLILIFRGFPHFTKEGSLANSTNTHLNGNHPEEGQGGEVALKTIPFFCLTCSITTFVLGSSFSFSFVQGFQSGGGATGGVRPVSAPQTSEGGGSQGFRSVGAPVTKPGTGGPPLGPPLAAQPANCWVCGRTVSGVFLQVKGIEYDTK